MTACVNGLPLNVKAKAQLAVKAFDAFTRDNDPYGEHDFGVFEIAGDTFYWKIDLYEEPNVKGSDGEPIVNRVLTICWLTSTDAQYPCPTFEVGHFLFGALTSTVSCAPAHLLVSRDSFWLTVVALCLLFRALCGTQAPYARVNYHYYRHRPVDIGIAMAPAKSFCGVACNAKLSSS